MSKIREAFEKWAAFQFWSLGKDSNGNYVSGTTHDGWIGYQAAIAAVKESIVVTTDDAGGPVCVTLQDEDCRILEVLWEVNKLPEDI